MTRRYLLTLATDDAPTLAAIRALPGVVGVEEVDLGAPIDRETELRLFTLLGFHPNQKALHVVVHEIRCRGWRIEPHLVAAMLCRLWASGDDGRAYFERGVSYARRGGYALGPLGLDR